MRLLIAICLLSLVAACTHGAAPRRLRTNHGSCEAMCDYYQYCKGDREEQRLASCISDCRSIFSEDGEMDQDALLQLQRLECTELLSFIEGDKERPLQSSDL